MQEEIIHFRGRPIYDWYGYPAVTWPNHPQATGGGSVRIHRVVAFEKYGGIPDGFHVHHKNEDKWDWRPENLKLVSNKEHGHIHNGETIIGEFTCAYCGDVFTRPNKDIKFDNYYCDSGCQHRALEKTRWPSPELLLKRVVDTSFSKTGRALNVSDNAVRKRLRNHLGWCPSSVDIQHIKTYEKEHGPLE